MEFDVAIIGGGPAGSTLGTLLKKYEPCLHVGIFEREVFPRDHIGESLLPAVCVVLDEMGCWDKVEAAGFPIKIGAAYRWGKRPQRWNFDFFPPEHFADEPRPAKFEGQRRLTAFQVDRSLYDHVLLNHAAELGCSVHQGSKVTSVERDGDRITGLRVQNVASGKEEFVKARYYVDASGNSGIFRRAMGVECEVTPSLKNVAIYDYWQNAEWAVKIGVGGTRIQVLSLGYGWIWFIPLGPTRTSIGLVVPADYVKTGGKSAEELYAQALKDESIVAKLIKNATSEGKLQTTRDWSFIARRQVGENWFLVGECAGFADPILSAGVSIAQLGAMQLACTILELDRGKHDAKWLRQEYEHRQEQRIRVHIRFGDYWYTANEQLSDLKEFTSQLAKDIGIELTPEGAWDWIARGGFIDEDLYVGAGGFSLALLRAFGDKFDYREGESVFAKYNHFTLDLSGATWKERAEYRNGTVTPTPCYVRGQRVLPVAGFFAVVVDLLQRTPDFIQFLEMAKAALVQQYRHPMDRERAMVSVIEILEGMINDGWVKCSHNPRRPKYVLTYAADIVRWETEQP